VNEIYVDPEFDAMRAPNVGKAVRSLIPVFVWEGRSWQCRGFSVLKERRQGNRGSRGVCAIELEVTSPLEAELVQLALDMVFVQLTIIKRLWVPPTPFCVAPPLLTVGAVL
jgi:hypothetical protein